MIEWIIFFTIVAIEAWENVFFLDTFLECRWTGRKKGLRYVVCFFAIVIGSLTASFFWQGVPSEIIRMAMVVTALALYCKIAYTGTWGVSIFLSLINYALLTMLDFTFGWAMNLRDGIIVSIIGFAVRCVWLVILLWIRDKLSPLRRYFHQDTSKWIRYAWFPCITTVFGLYFIINTQVHGEHRFFFAFLSACLFILNIVSMIFLKNALLNDEKLKSMELQIQKKKNQQQIFHDMQFLYGRQGQKLHDYRKQLSTIRELLENGENEAAVTLVRELTTSISVEMSEVNTGHTVVNAVLNHEYRMAKSLGIGMIFSIGDMSNLKIKDEDIVILLGNLIENAIHECEKMINDGFKDVAIRIKLSDVGGNLLFTVHNPVRGKVEIEDDKVIKVSEQGHGIGLVNVREVVGRYDGSFVISCDDKEFASVVLI